jgi:GT2 family glycosyltransferase
MIPVYNNAEYLRDTLKSVCRCHAIKEMQIEVIDNCSTRDNPEAVVQEIGDGRVNFFRQPRNVGAIENFNTCIRRARGEWVHILHSDDVVLPGFYSDAWAGLAGADNIGAALCRIMHIDENGQSAYNGRDSELSDLEAPQLSVLGENFVDRLFVCQRIQFAGVVVRRSTYEQVGGFRPELVHCSDWDMWIRVALAKPILYEPRPFACYRIHTGMDSAEQARTAHNVVDKRRAITLAATYVSSPRARKNYCAAMKAAAIDAIAQGRRFWKFGHRGSALRQIGQAVQCSIAPAVILRLGYFCFYAIANFRRDSSRTGSGKGN